MTGSGTNMDDYLSVNIEYTSREVDTTHHSVVGRAVRERVSRSALNTEGGANFAGTNLVDILSVDGG